MAALAIETASVLLSTGLEDSPYTIPSITLKLKDGSRFYVPAHLLAKSEIFSFLNRDGELQLDIPHEVAHVLVHYLFTDDYQCLRAKGSSMNQSLAPDFDTSIRVYSAAQEYKLPRLQELAKAEITRLGNEFRIPLVFDLVRKAYPNPNMDDTWLRQFLRGRLRILFTDPKELLEWDPIPEAKPMTISDMLLEDLIELLQENLSSGHKTSDGLFHDSHEYTTQGTPAPALNEEQPQDTSEQAGGSVVDAKSTNGPARNEADAEDGEMDAAKHDVALAKGDVSIIRSHSDIVKSESNTSKSDDEVTRNGVQTPESKADSCEPEIVKVEQPSPGADHVAKPTEGKKDEKDFWGLTLKKKKKKKAPKPFVSESLPEGVTVKP
ncbi:uncharacterized protein TRIREDRAFT_112578 [Trichoderma reesei QM6a]|uniref:Predicted protein n=2 Tax=Hypocrea jecorina TaxID=51453 RepID=G0RXF0_HYPJQ|nr:uncharacterized protein TRIREDRAFT_112578 [Trichoderma reesei QM6a]EGR44147.1 predicted protein [Trichoderma reesei QM6a]ETR96769.1 hypothetical protein M419DRAFT_93305 [Trichoderma reesei RUT C-30]